MYYKRSAFTDIDVRLAECFNYGRRDASCFGQDVEIGHSDRRFSFDQ